MAQVLWDLPVLVAFWVFWAQDCEPLHLPLLAHAAVDDPVGLEKMKQTLLERPGHSLFEMSDIAGGGSKMIKDDQRVKLNDLNFKGHSTIQNKHTILSAEKSNISIPSGSLPCSIQLIKLQRTMLDHACIAFFSKTQILGLIKGNKKQICTRNSSLGPSSTVTRL